MQPIDLAGALLRLADAIAQQNELSQQQIKLNELLLQRLNLKADDGFISVSEAAELLRCHEQTVRGYQKQWHEGIHFFRQGSAILYNKYLLLDWLKNRNDEGVHAIAVNEWLSKQPQNKRRKKEAA
jgi:hypothetical protein